MVLINEKYATLATGQSIDIEQVYIDREIFARLGCHRIHVDRIGAEFSLPGKSGGNNHQAYYQSHQNNSLHRTSLYF
jgi:hypothetical protein